MFSVGHNFDKNLIDLIKSYDVYEVYGKLSTDIIGGCRPPIALGEITKKCLAEEVLKAHRNNIEFNYLLNASCLGNIEYTKRGFRKIVKLLDYLKSIKIDTLTVTIPYLAEFIKKNYPFFKISVSTLAGVNNIKKFESWQALGIDSITLDISANRNFEFLRFLAKNKKCEVRLMVNQCCEVDCIYYNYHTNVNSHQSQRKYALPLEYCSFACKYRRTKDPSLLLNAPWIRPEDLNIYRELGFDKFKIVQRQDHTEKIVRSVKAYYSEKYEGNLLDIMNFVYNLKFKTIKHLNIKEIIKYGFYFFKPHQVNVFKLFALSRIVDDDYGLYIDNSALNGFLSYYIDGKCLENSCDKCNYCSSWVKKVIKFDKDKKSQLIKRYQNITNSFLDKEENLFK